MTLKTPKKRPRNDLRAELWATQSRSQARISIFQFAIAHCIVEEPTCCEMQRPISSFSLNPWKPAERLDGTPIAWRFAAQRKQNDTFQPLSTILRQNATSAREWIRSCDLSEATVEHFAGTGGRPTSRIVDRGWNVFILFSLCANLQAIGVAVQRSRFQGFREKLRYGRCISHMLAPPQCNVRSQLKYEILVGSCFESPRAPRVNHLGAFGGLQGHAEAWVRQRFCKLRDLNFLGIFAPNHQFLIDVYSRYKSSTQLLLHEHGMGAA